MIYYILILFFLNLINAFSITFPTFAKNKAIISNIDIKYLNKNDIYEFKKIFNKIPVIIFKNQKISPSQYYDFVSIFDDNYNNSISLYTSKPNTIQNIPQVELINKVKKKNIFDTENKNYIIKNEIYESDYNYLWHQDVVGSCNYLPPVVSSMYMLTTPSHSDDTLFSSYEDAYDMMDINMKTELSKLTVIHSNSIERQLESTFDYSGLRIDNKYRYIDDIFRESPLIVYSDYTQQRKSLLLNPKKFLRFKELKKSDSYDLYRHIMKKYVLRNNNIISHHWEDYDLCIFNNRKVVHSSSPKASYKNNRIFLQCRLASNEQIHFINYFNDTIKSLKNNEIKWEPSIGYIPKKNNIHSNNITTVKFDINEKDDNNYWHGNIL